MKLYFERGDKKNPSGNLLIYTKIKGENPIEPGKQIFAANVYISILSQEENLPVVTFPPIPYKEKSEMMKHLVNQDNIDIIKLDDFEFPLEIDEVDGYLTRQLEYFHEAVDEYVEIYSKRFKKEEKIDEDTFLENLFLKDVEIASLSKKSKKSKKESTPKRNIVPVFPQGNGILEKIHYLESMTSFFRHSLPKSPELLYDNLYKTFTRFWTDFAKQSPQYDVQNMMSFIEVPGKTASQIVNLYFQKFRAIYFERYEDAGKIKTKIEKLKLKKTSLRK